MARRGYCSACRMELPDHVGGCPEMGGQYDTLYDAEADVAAKAALERRRAKWAAERGKS